MPAHLIAEEGPLRGLVLNLEEGEEWVVGRDPDAADFVLEDSAVSRKHVRIVKRPDGVFVENLSKVNPTMVGDHEVVERTLLKEGDRVKIGHTVFSFSEGALPEEGAIPPTSKKEKKSKKKKGGYDDIFGDLEEPQLPPEPEPVEERAEEKKTEEPAPEEEVLPPPKEQPKSAYDTIFEDIEVPAEMPFNLLAETPLLLKVIGGPNAGAEIGLEKGRTYLLGKDANTCDIVFQDLSVSRNHARLTVTPDGVLELEDLGSKNGTLVSGMPLTEKRSITSQDLVAMGTTVFLIIDREAVQETIYSPILPVYEAPKPTTPEEVAAAVSEERRAGEAEDWRSKKIPPKHLVAAGALVVVFFIVFLSFFSLFKSQHVEIVQKAPHETIKEALAKYPAVQYSYNPASGKIFLTGHVLSAVDYKEMTYNLDQVAAIQSVENNVVIDELVWKTMNDVLSGNPLWRAVSISSNEPGKFIAMGYVQSPDAATQLSEYLTLNFPYLDRLQNKVMVEDVLDAQIQGLLQAQGFGAVSFQLTNGELILSGRYGENQKGAFNSMLDAFHKLDGVRTVRNFVVMSGAGQAEINLTQQYKVTGNATVDHHGYSAIVNGRIYALGEALDGMKITSIEPSAILLEKDGLKYIIEYTR